MIVKMRRDTYPDFDKSDVVPPVGRGDLLQLHVIIGVLELAKELLDLLQGMVVVQVKVYAVPIPAKSNVIT